MKNKLHFDMKKVVFSIFTAFVVYACGSPGGIKGDSSDTSKGFVGKAFKGPVVGGKVTCYGENGQVLESTLTNSDGSFKLKNQCKKNGKLVVRGGKDKSTGAPVEELIAPGNSRNITPITTLKYVNDKNKIDIQDKVSKELVENSLKDDPSVKSSETSKKLAKMGLIIHSMVEDVQDQANVGVTYEEAMKIVSERLRTKKIEKFSSDENKEREAAKKIVDEVFDSLKTDNNIIVSGTDREKTKSLIGKSREYLLEKDIQKGGLKGLAPGELLPRRYVIVREQKLFGRNYKFKFEKNPKYDAIASLEYDCAIFTKESGKSFTFRSDWNNKKLGVSCDIGKEFDILDDHKDNILAVRYRVRGTNDYGYSAPHKIGSFASSGKQKQMQFNDYVYLPIAGTKNTYVKNTLSTLGSSTVPNLKINNNKMGYLPVGFYYKPTQVPKAKFRNVRFGVKLGIGKQELIMMVDKLFVAENAIEFANPTNPYLHNISAIDIGTVRKSAYYYGRSSMLKEFDLSDLDRGEYNTKSGYLRFKRPTETGDLLKLSGDGLGKGSLVGVSLADICNRPILKSGIHTVCDYIRSLINLEDADYVSITPFIKSSGLYNGKGANLFTTNAPQIRIADVVDYATFPTVVIKGEIPDKNRKLIKGKEGLRGIDSDGDGVSDYYEILLNRNPFDASDASLDSDGDGFSDKDEINLGLDPKDASTALPSVSVDKTSIDISAGGSPQDFTVTFKNAKNLLKYVNISLDSGAQKAVTINIATSTNVLLNNSQKVITVTPNRDFSSVISAKITVNLKVRKDSYDKLFGAKEIELTSEDFLDPLTPRKIDLSYKYTGGNVFSVLTATNLLPGVEVSATPTASPLRPPSATTHYKWEFSDYSAGPWNDIGGDSASSKYTIKESDIGKYIGISIVYKDKSAINWTLSRTKRLSNYSDTLVRVIPISPTSKPVLSSGEPSGNTKFYADSTITMTKTDKTGYTNKYLWKSRSSSAGSWTVLSASSVSYTVASDIVSDTQYQGCYGYEKNDTLSEYICSNIATIEARPKLLKPGAVSINGSIKVAITLSATYATPLSVEALATNVTTHYEWHRADSSNAEASDWTILGTQSSYTTTSDDLGKYIRLRIWYTYAGGGYVSSDKSVYITGAAVSGGDSLPNPTTLTIEGLKKVGNTISASSATPSGIDNAKAKVHYQWYRASTTVRAIADWKLLSESSSYTLTGDDADNYIRLRVWYTYSDNSRAKSSDVDEISSLIVNGDLSAPQFTGSRDISGIMSVGDILSVPAVSVPADVAISYQWQRSSTTAEAKANWSDIAVNATGSEYVLSASDLNNYIKVIVSYNKRGYNTSATESNPSAKITNGLLVKPIFSGSSVVMLVGNLKVDEGTLSIPKVSNKPTGANVEYQWQRSSTTVEAKANWSNITGATDTSYGLALLDAKHYIRVRASYVKAGYITSKAYSKATDKVSSSTLPSPRNVGFTSGYVLKVNNTLTAKYVTPTAVNNLGDKVSTNYQWQSATTANPSSESKWSILATSSSYKLLGDDYNKYIRLRVWYTYNNDGYIQSQKVDFKPTSAVAIGDILPKIKNVNIDLKGKILKVVETAYATYTLPTLSGLPSLDRTRLKIRYEWSVATDALSPSDSWSVRATKPSYVLKQKDIGKYVRLQLWYEHINGGYTPSVKASKTTTLTVVTADALAKPLGVVKGLANIGFNATLSASASTPAGVSKLSSENKSRIKIKYSWDKSKTKNKWTNLGKSTSYTITASDYDNYIRLRIWYTQVGGPYGDSPPYELITTKIKSEDLSTPLNLEVAGELKVTSELTASYTTPVAVSSLGSKITTHYEWYTATSSNPSSEDKWVSRATSSNYILADEDYQKYIRLRVWYKHASPAYNDSDKAIYSSTKKVAVAGQLGSPLNLRTLGQQKVNSVLTASYTAPTVVGKLGSKITTYHEWHIATSPNPLSEGKWNLVSTSSNYKLIGEDYNKYVRLRVWYKHNGDIYINSEKSVYKTPAIIVGDKLLKPEKLTVKGFRTVGKTIVASYVTPSALLSSLDSSDRAKIKTHYLWSRIKNPFGSDKWEALSTSSRYEVKLKDLGYYISLKVWYTHNKGSYAQSDVAQTFTLISLGLLPKPVLDSSEITLNGSLKINSGSLSVPTNFINKSANTTVKYRWQSSNTTGTGAVWSDIVANATGTVYSLVDSDAGKYIRVGISYSRLGYTDSLATYSIPTNKVANGDLPTPQFSGSGVPITDGELKVDAGTLTAPSFEANNKPAGATANYRWQSSDITGAGAVWNNITATTTYSNYKLTVADVGKYIRVNVHYSKAGYNNSSSRNSLATNKVASGSLPTPQFKNDKSFVGIEGKLRINEGTLTAPALSEPSGVTINYQWQSTTNTSGTWDDITANATGIDYKLTEKQIYRHIRVKISYSRTGYSDSTSVFSKHTVKVTGDVVLPTPKFSGSIIVNNNLKIGTGSLTAPTSFTNKPAGAFVEYQWQRAVTTNATWSDISSNATGTNYKLSAGDAGKYIRVKIYYTKYGYLNSLATYSSPTNSKIIIGSLPTPQFTGSSVPITDGELKVDAGTLTAPTSFANKPVGATANYRWQSSATTGASAVWNNITATTTSAKYKLVATDFGKYIRVSVHYTQAGYVDSSIISGTSTTNKVANGSLPIPKFKNDKSFVGIEGKLRISEGTLTAPALSEPSDVTINYQWQSATNTSGVWSNIASNATGIDYKLTEKQIYKYVRVKIFYSKLAHKDSTPAFSMHTVKVTGDVVLPTPKFSGSIIVNNNLKIGTGSLTAPTSFMNKPADAFVEYQWQRAVATNATWSDISNATDTNYKLSADDVGNYIRVKIYYTEYGYLNSLAIYTTPTNKVANGDLPTPQFSGSGVPITDGELKVDAGTLTAPLFEANNKPDGVTVNYRWQSSDTTGAGAVWNNITATTTSANYKLVLADKNKYIRVRVYYSKAGYNNSSSSNSLPTNKVATGSLPKPKFFIFGKYVFDEPTLSSGKLMSESGTLASPFVNPINKSPVGVKLHYQWQRASTIVNPKWVDITDATSSLYGLLRADMDKYIRVKLYYKYPEYEDSAFLYSKTTAKVEQRRLPVPEFVNDGQVSVIGILAEAEGTLTAPALKYNLVAKNATARYQWQRWDNYARWSDIVDASSAQYHLQDTDFSRNIRVKVWYSEAGLSDSRKIGSEQTSKVLSKLKHTRIRRKYSVGSYWQYANKLYASDMGDIRISSAVSHHGGGTDYTFGSNDYTLLKSQVAHTTVFTIPADKFVTGVKFSKGHNYPYVKRFKVIGIDAKGVERVLHNANENSDINWSGFALDKAKEFKFSGDVANYKQIKIKWIKANNNGISFGKIGFNYREL